MSAVVNPPIISVIAAVGVKGQIGLNGKLPWNSPEDIKRFKYLTLGKVVIMGRTTYESLGLPLVGRQNIIITTQKDYAAPLCNVSNNLAEAIASLSKNKFNREIFIIGGESIYRQALPMANMLYLTHVPYNGPADKYMPVLPGSWNRIYNEVDEDGNLFEIMWRT